MIQMSSGNKVNKCAEDVTLMLEFRNFKCLPGKKKVEPYKHTAVTEKKILNMEVYLHSAMS